MKFFSNLPSRTLEKFPRLRSFIDKLSFKSFVIIFILVSLLITALLQLKLIEQSGLTEARYGTHGQNMASISVITGLAIYGLVLHLLYKASKGSRLSLQIFITVMWLGIFAVPLSYIQRYQYASLTQSNGEALIPLPLTPYDFAINIITLFHSILGLLYVEQHKSKFATNSKKK